MKKVISLLMIHLIILLPVYSAQVMAGMSGVVISGNDGINGFRRYEDKTTITLDAEIAGEPVDSSQVVYKDQDGELQFTCVDGNVSSSCILENDYLITGKRQFYIVLYDENGNTYETILEKIIIDNTAPTVDFSIRETAISTTQNITIDYYVYDEAYSGNLDCVGITQIAFLANEWELLGKQIQGCEEKGEISINLVDSGAIDSSYTGDVVIRAYAYDKFGQEAVSLNKTVYLDQEVPLVSDIRILQENQIDRRVYHPVTHIPYSSLFEVNINAVIQDPEADVNIDTVTLDFQELYPRSVADAQGEYTNLRPTFCNKIDIGYNCTWGTYENEGKKVFIRLNESGSYTTTISVNDNLGNTAFVPGVFTLSIDRTAPTIKRFLSSYTFDNENYLSAEENNISVEFTESGTMHNTYVWLDLGEFGGDTSLRADECYKQGGLWICRWTDFEINSANGDIRAARIVHLGGDLVAQDDAFNQMDLMVKENYGEFVVDTKPPVYINHSLTSSGSHGYNYTIQGDYLQLDLYIKDYSDIKSAKANLSEFYPGSNLFSGDCEIVDRTILGENVIKCSWSPSEPISANATEQAEVDINLTDLMGHELYLEYDGLKILEYTDTDRSIYSVGNVDVMPEKIDREITELIQNEIFTSFKFTPSYTDAEMLELSLEGCSGEDIGEGSSMDFIADYETMNLESLDSPNPYVQFSLKTMKIEEDSLTFVCTFSYVARSGLQVYPRAFVNKTFDMNFYNNPLGEIDESLNDKIEEVEEQIDGTFWKLIGTLATIEKYSSLFCKFFNAFQNFLAIMNSGKMLISDTKVVLTNSQVGKHAGKGLASVDNGLCESQTKQEAKGKGDWGDSINAYCKFINCEFSKPKDEGGEEKSLFSWDGIKGAFTSGGFSEQFYSFEGMITPGIAQDPSEYMNARDSLVISLISFCIPGIVYNLNKWRNIQCFYLDCLETQVPRGVTQETCEGLKDYQECKYLYGEFFKVFGFTAFFEFYYQKVMSVLYDPFALLGAGAGLALGCWGMCDEEFNSENVNWRWNACIGWKILSMLGEVVGQVAGIVDGSAWETDKDYCEFTGHSGLSFSMGGDTGES